MLLLVKYLLTLATKTMQTVDASKLTLGDVQRLLNLQKLPTGSFTNFLNLEPLTAAEEQDLFQIKNDFEEYLVSAKVSEGLIKFLTVAPLLRLAGFYRYPIKLTVEESVEIIVETEDTKITGRLDILAVNKAETTAKNTPFWILVIETKNSSVEVRQGLPQLLTYAFKNLEQQSSAWGLITNGLQYLFVHLRQGEPPSYQFMPEIYFPDRDRALLLLQILKAICQLQNATAGDRQ
jgi:hypothetical protein